MDATLWQGNRQATTSPAIRPDRDREVVRVGKDDAPDWWRGRWPRSARWGEDIPSDQLHDPMHFRSGGVDPGRDGCRVPLP
jgi:hypothetical protein